MPGQYRQDENFVDDGTYGDDGDRFPEAIQKRIANGWAVTQEERTEKNIPLGPGCGVGKGWLPVLVELDLKLAEIDPEYQIHQIKEKFGGLRYYTGTSFNSGTRWDQEAKEHVLDDPEEAALWNAFHALITEAEEKCAHLCEVCGEEGEIGGKHWLACRCPDHR